MYCIECGYNLRGLSAGDCPECARPFDPARPGTWNVHPNRVFERKQYAIFGGIALLLVLILVYCVRSYNASNLVLVLLSGVPGLIAFFAGIGQLQRPPLGRFILLAIAPMFLMLLLFYSLALHMYLELGGWPRSIGNSGYSTVLNAHAEITQFLFGIILLANLFLFPLMVVVCAIFGKLKGALYYLGTYGVSCAIGMGVILLAPSQFLNWWWD